MDQPSQPLTPTTNVEHPADPPVKTTLAARMKSYESPLSHTLPPSTPIILRLDGHAFSRFTSHFSRPFDPRIHAAMLSTCTALLSFFLSATLAYTQSDEITLLFPTGVGAFNDRVQKVASLAASWASVSFNKGLGEALREMPEPELKRGKGGEEVLGTAHFDARLFAVPSLEEALNCVIWRCRGDAVRNAIGAFARTMFETEEMHGKNSGELKEMMKERGVVFEDSVPKWAVEGCLVKRERLEHEGVNGKTGERERTWRTRVRVEERGIREFGEEGLRIVGERFW